MDAAAVNGRIVVVAGDVTMDWNLARVKKPRGIERGPARQATGEEAVEKARRVDQMWTRRGTTHGSFEAGGAGLCARLISEVAADVGKQSGIEVVVRSVPLPTPGSIDPADERFHHSFAIWSEFEGEGDPAPWRVQQFLGIDPAEDSKADEWPKVEDDRDAADLVVLDDGGLGFRDHERLWPQAIKQLATRPEATSPGAKGAPWVLLKMARPVAEGKLWEHLLKRPDRLIVVIRIDDLRLTEVQISRELSWERTAQDLVWELINNPRVNALATCAHVVVSFSTAGALLLSAAPGSDGAPRGRLFFDPRVMEDMWIEEHPGGMMGYTCCLTAAIAREAMVAPDAPDLRESVGRGIQRGLAAMRRLHLEGYEERGVSREARRRFHLEGHDAPGAARPRLTFPINNVVEVLAGEEEPLAVVDVRDPKASLEPGSGAAGETEPRVWTILEDRFEDLEDVAQKVVVTGADEVLDAVPLGQFADLLTVDRQEIEGFRSIRTLIREYDALIRGPDPSKRPKGPLSIAVFGPPGSGKSFGVKQVANSVLPGRIREITFNISQFDGPAQLIDALHQVRDWSLKGMLPLVFWDEFDSTLGNEKLGWLRQFLSPMQDGTFQDGQVTHPIGPAIFVFAGGTAKRMQEFASRKTNEIRDPKDPEPLRRQKEFRDVKGPDFVSRLKGYVNIVGPDPRDGNPQADPHHVIRRAILLRLMLLGSAKHLFQEERDGRKKVQTLQIDSGVLRAFLHTPRYRHGARSMESIIAMSSLAGKTRFERSCLPAEEQLDLHVNACDFLSRVLQPELTAEVIERLAEGAHVVFCANRLGDGYRWAGKTEEYLSQHPLLLPFVGRKPEPRETWPTLVPFEELGVGHKAQNRSLVKFMSKNLEAVNYLVWPARSGAPPIEFSKGEIEFMAEQEHDRWMREQLAAGWRYASELDEEARLQPALLPWQGISDEERRSRYGEHRRRVGTDELPEEQKERDRELVREYDRYLATAGYTAVKCEEPTE